MKVSPTKKNWIRYVLQWGVLAAIIIFVSGLAKLIFTKMETPDPEAFYPFGGLEALASNYESVPGYNMCVCVDIRYVLWVVRYLGKQDYVLQELGL